MRRTVDDQAEVVADNPKYLRDPLALFAGKHLGLLVTSFPFALCFVRMLAVSQGDWNTFGVLLRTLNVVALVLGTLAYVLPLLLIFLPYFSLSARRRTARSGSLDPRDRWVPAWVIASSAVAAAALLAWDVAALAVGTLALLIGLTWLFNRWLKRTGQSPEPAYEPESLVLLLIVLVTTFANPSWLPTEQIQTRDDPARVVYVLAEDNSHLTVLVEGTTRIEYIEQADVKIRFVCGNAPPPLLGLLSNEDGNPECSAR